jgi:hypothetical protein
MVFAESVHLLFAAFVKQAARLDGQREIMRFGHDPSSARKETLGRRAGTLPAMIRFVNVLIFIVEHASLYPFDDDTGTHLWRSSILAGGETPTDDQGCSHLLASQCPQLVGQAAVGFCCGLVIFFAVGYGTDIQSALGWEPK